MQITNNLNKKSNFFKENFLILIIIFLRFGSSYTSDLSYIFLIIFALTGRIQIVQALLLSWFFSMSNSDLIADSDYATIGRYLIVITCALSVLLRVSLKNIDKFQSPYWINEKKLDNYMLPSFTKKIVKYLERN